MNGHIIGWAMMAIFVALMYYMSARSLGWLSAFLMWLTVLAVCTFLFLGIGLAMHGFEAFNILGAIWQRLT